VGGPLWHFAVELNRLLELGVTQCDLRWLLHKDFVAHGLEITSTSNTERTFELAVAPMFCKRSCFVLTPRGIQINSLNRCQKQPLVRFAGDGLGTGIRWEIVVCRTA
jgi:hypothetical protein